VDHSVCCVVSEHTACSCQAGYYGSPPACRPECIMSTECPQDKACAHQKCVDPCPGTCVLNTRCQVVNHSPICTCIVGFIGDPFIQCIKEESKPCLSSVFNFVNSCFVCFLLNYLFWKIVIIFLFTLLLSFEVW
jgi:hypothetical protein